MTQVEVGDATDKIGTVDTEEVGGRIPRVKGTPAMGGMRQSMKRTYSPRPSPHAACTRQTKVMRTDHIIKKT